MARNSEFVPPLAFEFMRILVLVTVATLALARDSGAQSASVMAQAIPLVTRADPTATRSALTEGYLTQPAIMAHASWGWLRGVGTLNLEGLTISRGELSTGGYGEGYVDRRHPHTYLHELLVGGEHTLAGADLSLFAGRGFAPFGSDDPMVRPFEKYPINHHLAQILERTVAIAAFRDGPIIGELGTFNGDEPVGPGAPPSHKRFGDSWSSRLTVLPLDNFQVSGSIARVASPELPTGHGLDQHKASVVARYDRMTQHEWRYAMLEWAGTGERDHGRLITSLRSLLGEAAYCRRDVVIAARVEQTDRPEEEPLSDPFRTPRPSTDLSNLGVSRWTTGTLSVDAPAFVAGWFSGRPFVEIERLAVAPGNPPGIFSANDRYGSSRMWMFSAGVRLHAGMMMHDRMGRYGAALPPESGTSMRGMESQDMSGMPGMSGMQRTNQMSSSMTCRL